MNNTTTWVLSQKQLSKGYLGRRARRWGRRKASEGKPQMTKQIIYTQKYDSQQEAEKCKLEYITAIKSDITQAKKRLKDCQTAKTMTFATLGDYQVAIDTLDIGYCSFYGSPQDPFDGDKQIELAQHLDEMIETTTETFNLHTKELEFFDKKIMAKEIPLPIRYEPSRKRDITFTPNESHDFCPSCGCDVPSIQMLRIGYHANICVFCIEKLMPEFQKQIDAIDRDVQKLWCKEVFLKEI